MIKAGLILGAVMLVLGVGGSLISPICVPCLAVVAGIGAGYLAAVFDKPLTSGGAAKSGAVAGAIGGAGALLGQIIGGILNAIIVGPQGAMDVLERLGLPVSYDPNLYYVSFIGSGVCFGVLDIVLMAGLGALGGILWLQIAGKNTSNN
jgi:MFS family permease